MMRSGRMAPATADSTTSDGSMCAVIGSLGDPEARISRRSILLRNWRTLPGHSCTCNVAMASSLSIRLGRPWAEAMRSMK